MGCIAILSLRLCLYRTRLSSLFGNSYYSFIVRNAKVLVLGPMYYPRSNLRPVVIGHSCSVSKIAYVSYFESWSSRLSMYLNQVASSTGCVDSVYTLAQARIYYSGNEQCTAWSYRRVCFDLRDLLMVKMFRTYIQLISVIFKSRLGTTLKSPRSLQIFHLKLILTYIYIYHIYTRFGGWCP